MNAKTEDEFMNYIFATEPTFLEKCLTCEYYEGKDKDVGDQLCGANKNNIVTCRSVEIEMQLAKLSGCIVFKERMFYKDGQTKTSTTKII